MIRKLKSGGYRLYSKKKDRKTASGKIWGRSGRSLRQRSTSALSSSSSAADKKAVMRFAAALVATLLLAGPAHAQALDSHTSPASGTSVVVAGVADAGTGAPIEGAQVRVTDVGRIARTNWIGEATINDVPKGRRRVEVRKLGYAPSQIDLMITTDSIGPVFMLARSAESLDTVFVAGSWHPARMAEYFSRQQMGIGRFLSDSVLAIEQNHELAFVLAARFPGLRAVSEAELGGFRLVSTRPQTVLPHGRWPDPYCPVDVYLDGMLVSWGLGGIHPSDLAGVEQYAMASAPVQYRRTTGSCAVVLLWSKD